MLQLTVQNKITKRAQRDPRRDFEKMLSWHFNNGYDCVDIFYMDGEKMSKSFLINRLAGASGPKYPTNFRLFWYVLENKEKDKCIALWVNENGNMYYTFHPENIKE